MEKWKDYVYWTPTMSHVLSQILYLITFEFSQPREEDILKLHFQCGHWVSKHIICGRSEIRTRFIWLQSSLAFFSVMLWEWTECFTPWSVSSGTRRTNWKNKILEIYLFFLHIFVFIYSSFHLFFNIIC